MILTNVANFLFFVILNANLYIVIPDSKTITNMHNFRQFTCEKLNILNMIQTYMLLVRIKYIRQNPKVIA